jgi:3-hydroxyacyl-[acyl-carrier-protein] dehydratase
MPGVLILEALAQLGAIFATLCKGGSKMLIVFSGADDVRFRRLVVPGDKLRLELGEAVNRSGHWRMKGVATVEGEKAAEAILKATQLPER